MAADSRPPEAGILRVRLTVALLLTGCVTAAAAAALAVIAAGGGRRADLAGVGIVAACAAGALSVSLVVRTLHRAVAPLERVAQAVAADVRAAPTVDADREVVAVAGAYRRVARVLAAEEAELAGTRAAFRQALIRMGDVLGSTHDLTGIIEAVVETSLLVLPADAAVYYRVDGHRLVGSVARGIDASHLVLDGTGLAGAAARRRRVVMVGDPKIVPDPAEPTAAEGLAAPVHSLGHLCGVLALYGTSRFSTEDAGLVISLIRQAEVAVANVELHEQARRDALTDGVTGLWNRRYFDMRLRDAVAASQRFGEPFGVALFDLDDFKRINDRYDHFTGDAALVHFAAVLRRATREVDVACRWGGEEFAVLLQRTGPLHVDLVANRILEMLRDTPLVRDGMRIGFTASAGIASFPWNGMSAAEVVEAADKAMLRAKAAGKDRVERAEAPADQMVNLSEVAPMS